VNAAGGNLMVERLDLSMDTILGTLEIRSTYNATSGDWLWSFQVTYDGTSFLDPTGARHDVSAVSDGSSIAGTVYVKADHDTIETKGGLAFHFDANGQLAHMAWKTVAYPRLEYTRSASSLDIAQCAAPPSCTDVYAIALNADGNPTVITDARTSRSADFQYDGSGRLVVARDALDVDKSWPGFRYEYSLGGTLLTAMTNSQDERIEYVYQGNRRIRDVIQIGEGNPIHRFEYDAKASDGLYTTIHTNPVGAETRYRIDGERRLHQVELADAWEITTITWSGKRPSRTTLPSGATTSFTYVGDDVAAITQPSGNVISFAYDPFALNYEDISSTPISQIDDSVGPIQSRTYDASGRLVSVSNGEGEAVHYTHTATTLESYTNPLGAQSTFPFYGIHGHWLDMQGDVTDKRAFDPVGNVVVPSVNLQAGGVLDRSYDGNRNLESLGVAGSDQGQVAAQGAISIDRRNDGRPMSIARPGSADHDFFYDALGRLVERRERVDGAWQSTAFEYDLAGNRIAVELPNGMRQEFDFDGYGRVVSRRALRDGFSEGEATWWWQDGRVVAFSDSIRGTTEFYSHDAAGRVTRVDYGFGESIELEYDARSRRTAETFSLPGEGEIRRLDYGYDFANRLVSVTSDGGEELVQWGWSGGEIAGATYGNGLSRSYTYDAATARLTGATTTNALFQVVESTAIETTGELGPSRSQIRVTTNTTIASTEEQYWLEQGGSLGSPDGFVGKRVFGWNDGEGSSRSFAYDELSNLLSTSGDGFTYNSEGNRLLSATLAHGGIALTYEYDSAGFATARNGVPITWAANGRMASVGSETFTWDMRGGLVSSTVAGVTRDFSLFGGRVEIDPATGALDPLDLGFVTLAFGSSERTYRHFDFRGNVRFTSDENGAIVSHYRYTPYGLDAVFGAAGDPVRFAGRTQVGDLMLLGARVYDPAVGRFLSPDPVFQLVNQYTYTLGNPVFFWDPDGATPSPTTGPSNAQIRSYYMTVVKVMGVVTAGALATGNIPLAAAASTTGAVLYAIAAIDGTIEDFGGMNGFLGALGLPDLYPGACKTRCGSPKQRKEIEITFDPETGGSGEPGEAGGGGSPPPEVPPHGACAPTAVGEVVDLSGVLWFLGPLQLLLGALVLRNRRQWRTRR
jgi:RHS repeat-associated protein